MSYHGRIPLDREKGFSRRARERFEKRGRGTVGIVSPRTDADVKGDRSSQGVGSHITP